jgi:hypothetical protein
MNHLPLSQRLTPELCVGTPKYRNEELIMPAFSATRQRMNSSGENVQKGWGVITKTCIR